MNKVHGNCTNTSVYAPFKKGDVVEINRDSIIMVTKYHGGTSYDTVNLYHRDSNRVGEYWSNHSLTQPICKLVKASVCIQEAK